MLEFLRNKEADDINVARNFFRKGNYKKTEKVCIALLEKNQKDTEALALLAEVYLKQDMLAAYKSACLKLTDLYIEQNNYNKAVALLKILNKKIPDDTPLTKLIEVYKAANMFKELQATLFELGDSYIKKEKLSEAAEVFLEILKFNKKVKDLDICFNVIEKFQVLDNRLLVCTAVNDGITYATEKKDLDIINKLIDIASKYDCDLSKHIKITLDYFKKNPGKIDYFNKNALNYFINIYRTIDKDFLKEILNIFTFKDVSDVVDKILNKYNLYEIYELLFDIFTVKKDIEGLRFLVDKLNKIYDPSSNFADLAIKYYERIEDANVLYELGLFSLRCDNIFSAESILNKSLNIAKSEKNKELEHIIISKLDAIKLVKTDEPAITLQAKEDLPMDKIPGIDGITINKEKPEEKEDSDNIDIQISFEAETSEEEKDYNEALNLIRDKQYEKAIIKLNKMLDSKRSFNVLLNLGLCFEAIKSYEDAVDYYEKAINETSDLTYKKKILSKLNDLYQILENRGTPQN